MARGRNCSLRPSFDSLEDRCLMATGIRASLSNGLLRVIGTNQNDTITLRVVGRQLLVEDEGENARGFNVGQVSRIRVDGLDGHDLIRLDSHQMAGRLLMKPSQLFGGDGDDTILGGAVSDLIDGGPGADRLRGGPGMDTYRDVFDPEVWAVSQDGFEPEIASGDVIQEQEGNCQFLASLAAVAQHNGDILDSRIRHLGGGNYLVRMYNATRLAWESVPVSFNGQWTDREARPADPREFWTILYWRAYDRITKSQPGVPRHSANYSLTSITGFETWSHLNPWRGAQYYFEEISAALQRYVRDRLAMGFFVVADTPQAFRPDQNGARNLVAAHSYTVLEITPGGDVWLRNPWANPSIPGGAEFVVPWHEFVRSMFVIHVN